MRVGTFNVNGKYPDASIRSWVEGDRKDAAGSLDDPDIFIFGFQELDLSTGALLYSTSTLLEATWTEAIFSALGAKAGIYSKVFDIEVSMRDQLMLPMV
jgi:inositol polyphosphate 5-phosphatase INPP5B/F